MKHDINNIISFLILLLLCCGLSAYEYMSIEGWRFAIRMPSSGINDKSRIMVLFGGRNWSPEMALNSFGFDDLADRYNLILLSSGFVDNEYWEPQIWSGRILCHAVDEIEKRFNLQQKQLLFYGYSAGGQCVAHFYQWMPEKVAVWALHGCGYYPKTLNHTNAPGLITCGIDDNGRFENSRNFVYAYRNKGGQVLWKYWQGGHALSEQARQLARAWFEAFLDGSFDNKPMQYGEDDLMIIGNADNIDAEFRNPLPTEKIRILWQQKKE